MSAPEGAAPASPAALFGAFNRLALQGFGGVLPVAQRELCERLGWLTREQFLELLALAQVLPGPNIVNLALIYGDRRHGWRGAAAAAAGVLAAPLAIVLALALLAQQFQHVSRVGDALRGMGVVAAGLVLSTALRLLGGLRRNALGRPICAAYVGLTAATVGWLHWPLLPVVLGLGVSAFALALARQPR
ncbi:MAG: chromate transporter [Burkholderiales bacterium]|nr:chromate transporter [Burkholderiales bacterium]MDE1928369.1 chromate transporter [Burkholderiales bacterium]MDE2157968.1 chromate transporter [Burkholderiales bacterium]